MTQENPKSVELAAEAAELEAKLKTALGERDSKRAADVLFSLITVRLRQGCAGHIGDKDPEAEDRLRKARARTVVDLARLLTKGREKVEPPAAFYAGSPIQGDFSEGSFVEEKRTPTEQELRDHMETIRVAVTESFGAPDAWINKKSEGR